MLGHVRVKAVSFLALLSGVIVLLRVVSACRDGESAGSTTSDSSTESPSNAEAGADVDSPDSSVSQTCVGDGGLDPSFGDGGIVLLNFPGSDPGNGAYSVLLQADGKVLIGGSTYGKAALIRLLPNGSRDPDFGTSGLVEMEIDAGPSGPYTALGLQPDGKIVAAAAYPQGALQGRRSRSCRPIRRQATYQYHSLGQRRYSPSRLKIVRQKPSARRCY